MTQKQLNKVCAKHKPSTTWRDAGHPHTCHEYVLYLTEECVSARGQLWMEPALRSYCRERGYKQDEIDVEMQKFFRSDAAYE